MPCCCGGLARFSFRELCASPRGGGDYAALAHRFHTLFVSEVPLLSQRNKDQARRFISLVDEVYNRRGRLVCSAEAAPDLLFLGDPGEEEHLIEELEG